MVDEKSPVIVIMGVSRYRPGVLGITVSRLIKQSILTRRSCSSGLNARILEKCIGLRKVQFPYPSYHLVLWRTVIVCHRMILTLLNLDKTCFMFLIILKMFYLSTLGWYTCVNLIICWRLQLKYIMLIRPAITWLTPSLGLNLNWLSLSLLPLLIPLISQ